MLCSIGMAAVSTNSCPKVKSGYQGAYCMNMTLLSCNVFLEYRSTACYYGSLVTVNRELQTGRAHLGSLVLLNSVNTKTSCVTAEKFTGDQAHSQCSNYQHIFHAVSRREISNSGRPCGIVCLKGRDGSKLEGQYLQGNNGF